MIDEIERLKEALKFYADGLNYTAPLINDPYSGPVKGGTPVMEDRGARAREVLGNK